jgi:hypothetical protein
MEVVKNAIALDTGQLKEMPKLLLLLILGSLSPLIKTVVGLLSSERIIGEV